MEENKKGFNYKSLIAVTASKLFKKGADGKYKVNDYYKDRVYGRIEQDNKGMIVANDKHGKRSYRGSFDSLSYKTKQYIFDRFNNGEKSNKAVYLVKADPNRKRRPGLIFANEFTSKEDGKPYNKITGEICESEMEKNKLQEQPKVEQQKVEQPKAKKATKKGAKK